MSRSKEPPKRRTSGLLGDLESIRSLLDEEQRDSDARRSEDQQPAPPEQPADDDEDVPLLEDVVHGGVSINETFLSGEGDFTESAEDSGLNDEIFKALLSDQWRDSARDLLDEARAAIEAHQTEWTPAHTDELNEALRVRIDETVQHWLHEVVQERMDELRRELLAAVSGQIRAIIDEQFKPIREDPDGD